jgi:hypothetical protein
MTRNIVISLLAGATAFAAIGGVARSDDSTLRAESLRSQAAFAAQSQSGYAPIAEIDDVACCCPAGVTSVERHSQIDQQIRQLAETLRAPVSPTELSPADLARGAY